MQHGQKLQKKGICCYLSSFCCFFPFFQGFSSFSFLCVSFFGFVAFIVFFAVFACLGPIFSTEKDGALDQLLKLCRCANSVSDEINTKKKTLLEIKSLKPKVSDLIVKNLKKTDKRLTNPKIL